MMRVLFGIFLQPFHHAPVAADLRRRQAVALARSIHFGKILVHAENFRRLDARAEQKTQQLLSIVGPRQMCAGLPSGMRKAFSGELAGAVTSQWFVGYSISMSQKNSAEPRMTG